jgi:hypothetical protein
MVLTVVVVVVAAAAAVVVEERFICGDLGCDHGNQCIGRHAS